MSHGQRVWKSNGKIFRFKNKFLNFSDTKKFSTESFLTFRELQPLVSYKRVSYWKNTRIPAWFFGKNISEHFQNIWKYHISMYLFFSNYFFFFYMYMIVWSKQNTCSFVNAMPKYIHSNINPICTYTNTDVINMYMHTYIFIHKHIHIPF